MADVSDRKVILSIRELAQMLGITDRTLRRWRDAGMPTEGDDRVELGVATAWIEAHRDAKYSEKLAAAQVTSKEAGTFAIFLTGTMLEGSPRRMEVPIEGLKDLTSIQKELAAADLALANTDKQRYANDRTRDELVASCVRFVDGYLDELVQCVERAFDANFRDDMVDAEGYDDANRIFEEKVNYLVVMMNEWRDRELTDALTAELR